jgi:hypothetical protein
LKVKLKAQMSSNVIILKIDGLLILSPFLLDKVLNWLTPRKDKRENHIGHLHDEDRVPH